MSAIAQKYHAEHANIEALLGKLEGVQRHGAHARAYCPACGGKSRKLSVTQVGNRILIHCFACNNADAVLSAVGMRWADLMPPRTWPESAEEQRAARRAIREIGRASALSVLSLESKVVQIAAHEVRKVSEVVLNKADFDRLIVACDRIDSATNVLIEAERWKPKEAA